jgi:alpha-1,4-digalacturonate transport system substrate-binding protein
MKGGRANHNLSDEMLRYLKRSIIKKRSFSMKNRLTFVVLLAALALAIGLAPALAQDTVTLRFTCYQDGTECEVYRDLLDAFEADNSDIHVEIDQVAYQQILDNLPVQVEAGEGPDIARVTNFPGMSDFYLDMRPYLEDPDYFVANFPAPVLQAMRAMGDTEAISGFPDGVSVTGPYINRTLFEQAGIDVPSDSGDPVSWEEWTAITTEVAEATGTPYAIAVDRTGHRIAGPAMSMGAQLLDENGVFTIDTPGFRAFAELLGQWHEDGITPREVWLGAGDSYAAANTFFSNGELVMYMSGSWQINRFATEISDLDLFDWSVVPNPTGDGGSTGVAGGAGLVAYASTEYPEQASRVMEYLIQPEVYGEFSARTLSLPAQAEVAAMGVDFQTDNEAVKNALGVFITEIPKLQDQALALNYNPFAFAYYAASRDRLTQWMLGELTLDEALERAQQDIDDAVAAAAES